MHDVAAWLDGVTGGRANLVLFVLGAIVFVLGLMDVLERKDRK
jgi:hypothetical protein